MTLFSGCSGCATCNKGYRKTGSTCETCETGSTYQDLDSHSSTSCKSCTTCGSGTKFVACSTEHETQDRSNFEAASVAIEIQFVFRCVRNHPDVEQWSNYQNDIALKEEVTDLLCWFPLGRRRFIFTIHIIELPIGKWVNDYKQFLEEGMELQAKKTDTKKGKGKKGKGKKKKGETKDDAMDIDGHSKTVSASSSTGANSSGEVSPKASLNSSLPKLINVLSRVDGSYTIITNMPV